MARTAEMRMSAHAIDLMVAQQEVNDAMTNELIDLVMAATLLAVRGGKVRAAIIDPASFTAIVERYRIERIVNADGTRGVRLHLRAESTP